MADINTGPQPIPVSGNVTVIPVSAIDRNAGEVPTGTPQTPVPPAPIPASAVDRTAGAAPTPYQGAVTQSRATVTVAATAVAPAANTAGGGVVPAPAGALPISVADDGSTLTTAVRSFNFVGAGVVAVANTQTNAVTVTITGGGGGNANTGNIRFTNTTMYSLSGLTVNNSDLTHGATAGLTVPTNGSGDLTLLNYYGSLNVTTGTSPSATKSWQFDSNGDLNFPGGTFAGDDIEATGNFGFEMPEGVGFGILASAGSQEWAFGADGNLTLPGNTFAVNYANGTQVNISGGAANTGNVTFNNTTV